MIRRNTAFLVLIFVVLLVGVLYLRQQPEEVEVPTPGVDLGLFDFFLEDVAQVTVKNIDGGRVVLEQGLDGWVGREPAANALEIDQTRASSVIGQLVNLRRVDTPSIDIAPDALGLQNPTYTISLGLEDGTIHTLVIGNPSPTGTGYYARLDQGATLLLTKSTIDQALGLIETPPILPTPVPETEAPEGE